MCGHGWAAWSALSGFGLVPFVGRRTAGRRPGLSWAAPLGRRAGNWPGTSSKDAFGTFRFARILSSPSRLGGFVAYPARSFAGKRGETKPRRREAAKKKAATGWCHIPGRHMKTVTDGRRLVVGTPGSSAGGATEDRPGRKPGFTGPPRPEPQRGDRIQPPFLRRPIGSCGRHPTRPPHSVSRRDERKRSAFSARAQALAEGGPPQPGNTSRPSRLRVRQDMDRKEPHAKTRSREEEGSNGVVSRSRSTHEDGDRRPSSRCRDAWVQRRRVQIRSRWRCMPPASLSGRRAPAPEARQKIGPGVSPGSPVPPRPEPQRGDRIQPFLLRCPSESCGPG
jgi:hypothetical protein